MGPSVSLIDLTPFLSADRVVFLPEGSEKDEILANLAEVTARSEAVTDGPAFARAIFEREEVSSTGIGGGIAVPHAKLPSVESFVITIGISRDGIPFDAKDGGLVHLVVTIAASDDLREDYLKVLATVASRFKDPDIYARVVAAEDPDTVVAALLA